MNKLCIRCNISKPREEFHKNSNLKDGLQTYCKACVNLLNREGHYKRVKEGPTVIKDSKTCPRCNNKKPISQFGKRSGSTDGHQSYCKPCWLIITKAAKAKQK